MATAQSGRHSFHSLAAIGHLPRDVEKDVREALALARRFNREVVRPRALEIDARVQDDPSYLPIDIVEAANGHGLFTAWLPRLVGGWGLSMLSLYFFIEEVSAECVGIANVVGVHYLGVCTLFASWNMKLVQQLLGEVVEGERRGRACLISLAITEPEAGTDMEETELLDRARIGTLAKPVDGGYLLNGRKVFISNGHLSTWHMVITCTDRKRAADTMVMLALKSGSSGFSFGVREEKMGQKACVASELVFDDCFVPAERVAVDVEQWQGQSLPMRELTQYVIDYVVSSTRPGVGAFAAGVARGAYERVRAWALESDTQGCRPIEHQDVKTALAEMYKNFSLARLSWTEAVYADCMHGLYRGLFSKPLYVLEHRVPAPLLKRLGAPVIKQVAATHIARRLNFSRYSRASADISSGWGSLSKFAASDLALRNADMALEIMGAEGLRHDSGVEKMLRDVKLLQIYEGTNQLNRLNLFKTMVMPEEAAGAFT